jgi:hypothetical protein
MSFRPRLSDYVLFVAAIVALVELLCFLLGVQ